MPIQKVGVPGDVRDAFQCGKRGQYNPANPISEQGFHTESASSPPPSGKSRFTAGGCICSTSHVRSSPPRARPPHLVREVRSQVAGAKGEAHQAPPHGHRSARAPSRGPAGEAPRQPPGAGPPLLLPGEPRGSKLGQSARGPPPPPPRACLLKGPLSGSGLGGGGQRRRKVNQPQQRLPVEKGRTVNTVKKVENGKQGKIAVYKRVYDTPPPFKEKCSSLSVNGGTKMMFMPY